MGTIIGLGKQTEFFQSQRREQHNERKQRILPRPSWIQAEVEQWKSVKLSEVVKIFSLKYLKNRGCWACCSLWAAGPGGSTGAVNAKPMKHGWGKPPRLEMDYLFRWLEPKAKQRSLSQHVSNRWKLHVIPSVHTQTWDTAMASHFHSTSRSQASCSSKRFNGIKLDLYGFIFYHFLVKTVSNGPFTFLLRGKAFGGASSGGGTSCRYVVPWARDADLAELFGSKRSDCFPPFPPFRPVYPLKQNSRAMLLASQQPLLVIFVSGLQGLPWRRWMRLPCLEINAATCWM